MITFKCKMCGGDLSFEQGSTIAECPYCGTTQTLPKLDDDKRANLYDRANHFRRQNEYDKATAIYEQILAEDRTDAEAYWSLVLCRYGIEYVEDPASHKRVPTVNRVQYASILADEDYKSALQYADTAQRSVYEAEANAIAEIQKGILDISRKEAPFDVFICYKETDANGRRTSDSVLANDMYHQLTKEGFKVFFSRITLEDKIGTAYEPYIFAALNSAKVMVVLGTKPEYFNAVWVKNEWSRYLALIRNGADKTLVPAYRDMDPYDLPDEFAHLQAQDMSKLGFMQDLIRGIKKILHKDEPQARAVSQKNDTSNTNIENLMKRAQLFMEDGDWKNATEYLDKVLDENAEYAPAYVGKVQTSLKLRKQEELAGSLSEYEKNPDWQKAIRFATPVQREVFESYVSRAMEMRENNRKEDINNRALQILELADTAEVYNEARTLFESITGYKDADDQVKVCDEKIEDIKRLAKLQFEAVEKVNAIQREMDQKSDAIRKAYSVELKAWQSSEQRYEKAKNELMQARQSRDNAADFLSRAQGELQNLRGLFTGRRRRELDAEITEHQHRISATEAEIKALEAALVQAETERCREPVAPDLSYELEVYYSCAQIYREAHMYEEAWKLYNKLKGYKDVDSIIENDENIAAAGVAVAAWRTQFEPGKTVQYGHYEQDNNTSNGTEAIEWIVLANEGDTATLISKYGLDARQYSTEYESVTWETCTLRKWLNGDFLNASFSAEEHARLETVTVTADKNQKYGTNPGNDTQDKVFLLSIDEVNVLFSSDDERRCQPTAYTKAHGAYVESSNCVWWLRSLGGSTHVAASVNRDGSVNYYGSNVSNGSVVVRPVVVLRLS